MKCYLNKDEDHLEAQYIRNAFGNSNFMKYFLNRLSPGGVFYNFDLPDHTHMTYKWYWFAILYRKWQEGKILTNFEKTYLKATADQNYRYVNTFPPYPE